MFPTAGGNSPTPAYPGLSSTLRAWHHLTGRKTEAEKPFVWCDAFVKVQSLSGLRPGALESEEKRAIVSL